MGFHQELEAMANSTWPSTARKSTGTTGKPKMPDNIDTKFFATIGEELLNENDVDGDLATILVTHLLRSETNENAVDNAVREISNLARQRVTSKEEDSNDG